MNIEKIRSMMGENGFVDAVEYRMIELPGYAVRKLEGGFRG